MLASPREVTRTPSRRASSRTRPSLPWPVEPMMAKPVPALPRDADKYAYEFKWDGYRTLLFVQDGKVRVQSRNLRDVTGEYPELAHLAEVVPADQALLDGEVVVLDGQGMPSFQRLQNRAGFRGPKVMAPITFIAFDLLWLEGKDLRRGAWEQRRQLLEALELEGPGLLVPPSSRDGEELLEAAQRLGMEGVVAKRLDSVYEDGRRSGAWQKVKLLRRQEFVIGGYTLGEGMRRGSLGALLIGYYEGKRLRFAGRVGTGFTDQVLRQLRQRLKPLEQDASPFSEAVPEDVENVFVAPRLVCEVEFREWTDEGILRQPSYKGLRADKAPREVVREPVGEADADSKSKED